VDTEGRTALMWSADRAHPHITLLLLQKNAKVDAKDQDGMTALHYACVCGHPEIVSLLIEHGADADTPDNDGTTPRESLSEDLHHLLRP